MTTSSGLVSYTIEAELDLPFANVQVAQIDSPSFVESELPGRRSYRFDLCLTPRLPNAQFCFSDHWAAHRFKAAGKLFLIPPGHSLRVRSDAGRQGAIICNLPETFFQTCLDEQIAWGDTDLEASLDVRNPGLVSLLLQLGQEARHPGFAAATMAQARAVQIAVLLQRHFRDRRETGGACALSNHNLRAIDERLAEIGAVPSLFELATLCGLSVRQLSRAFRDARGISIGKYVARKRLDHSKAMLLRGQSIKSIAYALSFSSSSSFCHAFRQSTGMTPKEFKTMLS